MADYNEIERALSYVSNNDDRETWVRMGAGIKSELGEDGFDIWDRWSSTADNYSHKAAKAVWKSLRPGRVNIGSVFYEAKQGGYTPEKTEAKTYTKAELAARAKARQEREAKAIADRLADADMAKDKAQELFNNAGPVNPNHPYLLKKGINDPALLANLRQQDNNLLIPARQNGEIVAVQKINHDGGKYFGKNEMLTGSAFFMGDKSKTKDGLILTEGLATGASLHAATNKPVLVVFAAHNLVNVAESLKNTDFPIILAADNDSHTKNAGLKFAEKAAQVLGERATINMPIFTEQDNALFQDRHGADKYPSDFNDLHEIRGLDAVKQAMGGEVQTLKKNEPEQNKESEMETKNTYAMAKDGEAVEVEPVNKTGQALQEPDYLKNIPDFEDVRKPVINKIEVDFEQVKAQTTVNRPPQETTIEPESSGTAPKKAIAEPEQETVLPSKEVQEPVPEQPGTKAVESQPAAPAPIEINPLQEAPESIRHKYLYAEGMYLDENARTTIFSDKGAQLQTARSDLQTIHDMVEVAKEKGWTHIKLSGKNEFKRQAFLEAESQGIKTSGYTPTKEDLAALKSIQNERALNKFESVPEVVKEHVPEQDQSANKVPSQSTDKDLNTGILKAHGQAPYLHDEKNKGSYYVILQQGDKEHTVWGVGLPDALEESKVKLGDEVSLKNLGRQPVEVDKPIYDDDGKTVIGHETIQTHRNTWQVDILSKQAEKGQEADKENTPAVEQKQEKDNQALAASEAAKLKAQNQAPTAAQIETSEKADIDSDVKMADIGGQSVNSEVKLVADKMAQSGTVQGLDKSNLAKLNIYRNIATKIVAHMNVDFRKDAMRNFDTNIEKSINGTTLNVPEPIKQQQRQQQQAKPDLVKQTEMEMER
jgi:putative DNA primase/helicase